MSNFKTFDDYMAGLSSDSQKRIHDKAQLLTQSIELAKLRQALDLKQSQLAEMMGVSQANISKLESGKDMYLSTLQKYVTALGGEIHITARMPNGDVELM